MAIVFDVIASPAVREPDWNGKPQYSILITQYRTIDRIEVAGFTSLTTPKSRLELTNCLLAVATIAAGTATSPLALHLRPVGKAPRGWKSMKQPQLTIDPALPWAIDNEQSPHR